MDQAAGRPAGGRKHRHGRAEAEPGREDETAVYNPLTGNRQFFANLEDDEIPGEERTVSPPAHRGAGQRFVPRRRRGRG